MSQKFQELIQTLKETIAYAFWQLVFYSLRNQQLQKFYRALTPIWDEYEELSQDQRWTLNAEFFYKDQIQEDFGGYLTLSCSFQELAEMLWTKLPEQYQQLISCSDLMHYLETNKAHFLQLTNLWDRWQEFNSHLNGFASRSDIEYNAEVDGHKIDTKLFYYYQVLLYYLFNQLNYLTHHQNSLCNLQDYTFNLYGEWGKLNKEEVGSQHNLNKKNFFFDVECPALVLHYTSDQAQYVKIAQQNHLVQFSPTEPAQTNFKNDDQYTYEALLTAQVSHYAQMCDQKIITTILFNPHGLNKDLFEKIKHQQIFDLQLTHYKARMLYTQTTVLIQDNSTDDDVQQSYLPFTDASATYTNELATLETQLGWIQQQLTNFELGDYDILPAVAALENNQTVNKEQVETLDFDVLTKKEDEELTKDSDQDKNEKNTNELNEDQEPVYSEVDQEPLYHEVEQEPVYSEVDDSVLDDDLTQKAGTIDWTTFAAETQTKAEAKKQKSTKKQVSTKKESLADQHAQLIQHYQQLATEWTQKINYLQKQGTNKLFFKADKTIPSFNQFWKNILAVLSTVQVTMRYAPNDLKHKSSL